MIVWLNGAPGAGKSTTARALLDLLPGSALYDPEPLAAPLLSLLPGGPPGRGAVAGPGAADVEALPAWRSLLVDTAAALLTEVPGPLLTPRTLLRQEYRDEIFGRLAARRIPVHHVWLHTEETILRGRTARHLPGGGSRTSHGGSSTGTLATAAPESQGAPPHWIREEAHVVDTTHLTPGQVARAVADAVEGGSGVCDIVQTPEPTAQTLAAGVLLFDEEDRVLLVDPTYKPGWEFPGGVVEAGEAPLRAGLREVSEELGIDLAGEPRLLVVDWEPPRPPGFGGLRFLFDGGRLAEEQIGAFLLPETELRGWRFVTEDEAARMLPPVRFHRLHWALRARERGCPLHLEAGAPVG